MNNVAEQLKQGVGHALESLSEGWRELKARAGGALTRFRSDDRTAVADESPFGVARFGRWACMAADVADDDDRVLVRLEAPGMRREDFTIEVVDRSLRIRGEKRFDRQARRDTYTLLQCAYGAFERDIALPLPVQSDKARATYKDGVLRVELPKAEGARRRRISVKVH